ncbi:MAG: hypothetical protein ACYDBV_12435 [Nitrospiria bacterium]
MENILETKLDATKTLREAGGAEFMQWAMKKLNNIPQKTPAVSELVMLANNHPGKTMTDEQKINILKKMEKAGIII